MWKAWAEVEETQERCTGGDERRREKSGVKEIGEVHEQGAPPSTNAAVSALVA